MFQDFRDLEENPIETDICIVGAGPAGIAIALSLIDTDLRVCVVESGGFKVEQATQALCKGEIVGLPYWRPLHEVRFRYFGGSTSRWGAWLAPLNDIDFETRSWIPHSGWPISKADLEEYYAQAHDLSKVGSYDYDPQSVGLGRDTLHPFDPHKLTHRLWHFGAPTRYGRIYKRYLKLAQNVRVILHANVTELETDPTGHVVTGAKVAALEGRCSFVRAKVFVLATGGLEVPRILLLSRSVQSAGIGNQHDLVGRFFMEHPHIDIGTLVLSGDRQWVRNYQMTRLRCRVVRPKLCVPEEQQRELRLINCSCSLDIPDEQDTGYNALRRIRKGSMDPFERGGLLGDIASVVANPLDVAFGLYSKVTRTRYAPQRAVPAEISLRARVEQIPNPASRVTLSDKRDRLGLNQIKLDWQLNGAEMRGMKVMCDNIASECQRLGIGEVRPHAWLLSNDQGWPDTLQGGPHHMGTARMSDSPKQGVVDRNCQVHGMRNLFIAGSAVFPTSGYANPTLTIVALALRLANYLKKKAVRDASF